MPGTTLDEIIIDYLKPYGREMGGVLLAIVSFISTAALLGYGETTPLGVWTAFLKLIFGNIAIVIALIGVILGIYLATLRMEIPWRPETTTAQNSGFLLLLLS